MRIVLNVLLVFHTKNELCVSIGVQIHNLMVEIIGSLYKCIIQQQFSSEKTN